MGGLTSGETSPFQLAADANIVGEQNGTQMLTQNIGLSMGWNMVSDPFVYAVYWGQVQVYYEGHTYTLDQAVGNGWMSKTLFSWNSTSRQYDTLSDDTSLIVPWTGYWLRAMAPVTLVFRAGDIPGVGCRGAVGMWS